MFTLSEEGGFPTIAYALLQPDLPGAGQVHDACIEITHSARARTFVPPQPQAPT
ncbi:MAG: hypothetical protein MUF03_12970 [Rubrivivax sp.]|nr:hypothetical protein [Rubrivivax sp.]